MPYLRFTDRLRNDNPMDAAESRPSLKVLLAAPRGFCAGVQRAIDAVRDALSVHGAPIYVRRSIVHNREVVRGLEDEGAVFVEELDQVPVGSVVIFSAHGVAPSVTRDARRRGLVVFDAVCPLVSKVHREVERHSRDGRTVIIVGHFGHPEIEGTLGHVDGPDAFVVNSVDHVAELPLARNIPAAYAIQTTYSVDEASAIVGALRQRFPNLAEPSSSDICYATTNRQMAVRSIAGKADAVIVVGEQFSSNACRLAEVAAELCENVHLIAGPGELDWSKLPKRGVIGLTAAASTPDCSVKAILNALSGRYEIEVDEVEATRESTVFKRMAVS